MLAGTSSEQSLAGMFGGVAANCDDLECRLGEHRVQVVVQRQRHTMPLAQFGRIQALGDRHDVAELLASADIFAYAPWPHEGTRDLVVLEAMATGLPCVVSDVPCVRESVDGRMGQPAAGRLACSHPPGR